MKMQFTLLSTVKRMAKQQVAIFNNCTLRKECAMNVAVISQAHYDASVLIGEQYLCVCLPQHCRKFAHVDNIEYMWFSVRHNKRD